MKTNALYSTFLLCVLILVSSCTVQKRVHLPGFHVQRNQKNKQPKSQEQVAKFDEERTSSVSDRGLISTITDSTTLQTDTPEERWYPTIREKESINDYTKERALPFVPEPDKTRAGKVFPRNVQQADPNDPRVINNSGLIGIILTALTFVNPVFIFGLPIAVALLIIGLVQTNREPQRYKGKKLYIAGLVIVASYLVGVLFLILLLNSSVFF
ncbi:MAG: hypothetical protein ACI93E_000647 [Flavobacteriales bacterium]|jgi:hypothetical protein